MARPPALRKTMEVVLKMSALRTPSFHTRQTARWLAVSVLPLLALTGSASAATVDPALARMAADHPGRRVTVIVQFSASVPAPAARDKIRWTGGVPGTRLPLIHGVAARGSAKSVARLMHVRGVRAVTLNAAVHSQASNRPDAAKLATVFDRSIHADGLWSKATGAGIGVAVIDTGIAGDLPDFRTSSTDPTSRVFASVVTNPDATTATDAYGHGTHVAGLIAGNGADRGKSDPLFARYAGSAPDASLISIKASDDQGNSSVIDVINGLQFAVEHKGDLGIRVINMSLQAATPGSAATDPLDAAVEAAWLNGIVVVTAAGNLGAASDAVQYAPGNDPYVITVGAVADNGSAGSDDDTIPSWSGRGTTQDGYAKPDIYAPGSGIVSDLAPGSAFASMCPTCIVGGQYIRAGGTSMAAPIVAGIAADLLQLHPDWTPDQVKGAIVSSGHTTHAGALEIDGNKAANAHNDDLTANVGLTPSAGATAAMGAASPTRSSWSRSSWSQATGGLVAAWARSSWSCACSSVWGGAVDPTRSSWSRSSWSSILGR